MQKELFNELYSSLVLEIKKEFKFFNIDIETKDDDIIVAYMNWRRRFISNIKRKVFLSKELNKNPKYKSYKKVVNKLISKFRNGEDITSFLSKGIVDNPYSQNIKSRSTDKDIFLNAFGIHHLHLNNVYEQKQKCGISFIKRNNDLLYILIEHDKVYFINIDKHNFGNQYLFQIIKNNWEYLIEKYELRGLISTEEEELTDQMMYELISHGVSVSIRLEDKVYCNCDLVSSGHNGSWMFDYKKLMEQLEQISFSLTYHYADLKKNINLKHNNHFDELELKFVVQKGYVYLIECKSCYTITINYKKSVFEIYETYCLQNKYILDFNY